MLPVDLSIEYCTSCPELFFLSVFNEVSSSSPHAPIELQHFRVGLDAGGVKVHHPQALQTPGAGEGHVRLPYLEATAQGKLNTVQCHALVGIDRIGYSRDKLQF